jgi:DNA-binding transcriptional MerR regulator
MEQMSLKDVARVLGVKPYRVQYALTTGAVPEPKQVSGRRIFAPADVTRLAAYFGAKPAAAKAVAEPTAETVEA